MTFSEIFMIALTGTFIVILIPIGIALAYYAIKFLYELAKLALQLIIDDIK